MESSGDNVDVETLLRQKEESATAVSAAYTLTVVEGVDRGAWLTIDGTQPSRVLVGKSPTCALRLTDPEVSRRHLAIDSTEEGVRVTDLGSTNGTVVNGLRVYEALLKGGEAVLLGRTVLRLDLVGPPAVIAATDAMRFGRLIGSSLEMRRLYPLCERLAASNLPVVLEGETGTGKELLAESLHEMGPRAGGPFVVFDCATVSSSLVESVLFGHEQGAFAGAVATRKGVFELADGGTLLIDEVGDLDIALQAKLLRAIERSEAQRVGGEKFFRFDVRILAATRRDLDREVQGHRFRDDLYFRLAVARLELPPLRMRHGDVPFLARHFWRQLGRTDALPSELLLRFDDYPWPGNVRELHNAVLRHLALGDIAPVSSSPAARAMPPPLESVGPDASSTDIIDEVLQMDLPLGPSRQRVVDEFERRYVAKVLARHGGSVVRAAAASGIARRYFQILRARQNKADGEK